MPDRSPIIFWLLLAATVAVDAVIIVLLISRLPQGSEALFTVFLALSFAQISVASIWVAFVRSPIRLRWILPFALSMFPAIVMLLERFDAFIAFVTIFELYSLVALGAMMLLAQYRAANPRWQFSLMHVLVMMTLAAVMTTLIQSSTLVRSEWHIVTGFIITSVLLAASAVLTSRARGHWVLRLAALLGIALLSAWVCALTQFEGIEEWNWPAFNLIQVTVLGFWLQWNGLLPQNGIVEYQQQPGTTGPQSPE